MSGDWAWQQSIRHLFLIDMLQSLTPLGQDTISTDPSTHGVMFVPIILGSDKTTVSVTTGQNEYYPLYLSISNIQNHMRRVHKNALVVIGFLPILKGKSQTLSLHHLCSHMQQVPGKTLTQKSSDSSNEH